MSPFQILMKHRSIILPIHKKETTIPKTYKKLLEVLPEIKDIKFNTFKQYMPRLIEIADQLDEETKVLVQEKTELEKSLQALKIKADQSFENKPGEKIKVDEWNVVQGSDGYFRANRKIKGKVVSVYLGKKLNVEKAREKIRLKLKKLKQ